MPDSNEPEALDSRTLPRHVAVIMDGNGRWAQQRGLPRVKGHEQGAESVRAVVRTSRKLGIQALTLYAFSEENWARPKAEVAALWKLLMRFLKGERKEMLDQDIRLNAIGSLHKLPDSARKSLRQVMADTAHCKSMVLTLALSYGGQQELTEAARRLAKRAKSGEIDPETIDEKAFADSLYTAGLPDVDFLIRTSGELRISNFLLWQVAYAEFYFTDTYFPDFREEQLKQALADYASRQRRFGQTGEQVREADHGR